MSLKDALKKAGYKDAKAVNERDQKAVTQKTKVEKHQENRNFCEVCEFIQPDVERFKHNNALVDAEWICSNCADKSEILDEFRKTEQSDSCKNNRYRRYYGPTNPVGFTKKVAHSAQKDTRNKPNYKHDKNKNRNSNGNSSSKSSYTVDKNGDKNFNC